MSDFDFLNHVSSVTALSSAIDGTTTKKTRVRDHKPVMETVNAWRCPACGFHQETADDHARHMAREWLTLRNQIRAVRDLLGPEPIDIAEREAKERVASQSVETLISTDEAAVILGLSTRQVSRLVFGGGLSGARGKGRWS